MPDGSLLQVVAFLTFKIKNMGLRVSGEIPSVHVVSIRIVFTHISQA